VLPDVLPRLRAVFAQRLHMESPLADADLLQGGVLDSLQFVDLLAAIERAFGITIPLGDLDFDRLSTLAALAELVNELGESAHDAGAVGRTAALD
jgi:acyl carrier protein